MLILRSSKNLLPLVHLILNSVNGSNVASDKLLQIGIDINSIKFEHYHAKDRSRLNTAMGDVKSSSAENVKFWKFNQVDYDEARDGRKVIVLSIYPATENDLKDIVEGLTKVLGTDSAGRHKLQQYELVIYRNDASPNLPIREWQDFEDFNVVLKGYSGTKSVMLSLSSK